MQVKRRINMDSNYETEFLVRWGATDAYRKYEQKTKTYIKEKWAEAKDGLIAIFRRICRVQG